ncbi:hypothetical protein [Brachybacterium sacelli]|uniref:NadR/Ttd14 AAA domain-containing protein n=1 Tax=Brachybacterium sacelli TaxID=173364 RepID=A0ABS4X1J5_9MICO|nr:hypothetical protein [Brachybacterium sacelli]MBP2382334.1 hypothetical protein [Brachybacterium sacelli]
MTRLLAVTASSPGAGKSTLCDGLVAWLRAQGLRVDHFREEEVLTREAFAPLAQEFSAGGEVQLSTLLDTTEDYLGRLDAQGVDVAVTDALVPFIPSLRGWGHDESGIADFLRDLEARLMGSDPIVVYLDEEPPRALARAIEREGPAWQDWFLTKLGSYPVEPPVRDLEGAHAYFRYERTVTLRLLEDLPWQVIVVPQSDPPSAADVLHTARRQLEPLLVPPANPGP